MGKLRKLGAIVFCAYVAFMIAGSLHAHTQETQQWTLHCKLCQISQTSLEQSSESPFSPELAQFGFCATEEPSCPACGCAIDRSGRSPPLS